MGKRAALLAFVAACSPPPAAQDGGAAGGEAQPQQSIGGVLSGLDPALGSVQLGLGTQELTLTMNGPFTFPMKLAPMSAYDVRVAAAPMHQRCAVDGGTGTVAAGADVTSVSVDCALARYTIGGALTGTGGVTLTESISAQALDAGPGAFRFPTPVPYRSTYQVTAAPPQGWHCTVDGGGGTVTGDVGDIVVACAPQTFALGGTVTGLDAPGLVLAESATAQQLAVDAGAQTFTFAQPVPYGTAVNVTVAAHPGATFCRVSNGAGLVTAAKSDVAVTCRGGHTVGGAVTGLTGAGLVLRESGTQQLLALSPDAGTVAFDFPLVVPAGDAFDVGVAAQPAGQSCVVTGGAGVATAPYRGVAVECFRAYPDLIVNEVSSAPGPGFPVWFELYNGTTQAKNLADYQLRTGTLQLDAGPGASAAVFALPDAGIAPGRYLVVSSKPFADLHDNPQIRFVATATHTFWFGDGGADFIELRAQGGTPIDSVALGGSGTLSAQQWSGAPLDLPGATNDHGKSLARRPASADTNTRADFALTDWPTPAGPNDAIGSVDADQDGLPDTAEVPGGRYAGLPLYDWGARTGRRDIFLEVDWVKPDAGASGFEPGILPRREALQRVHDVFAAHGLELHFDTGDLYDAAPGIDPADFDLGGGNETAFACTITMSNLAGATSFYLLKAANSDLRRRVSFHYVIFGNSLADVACGGVGSTGRAEQDGNDVVVTLGMSNLRTTLQTELNRLINSQSSTLMHELGHNLGLRHGGFEDRNYKPNYLSVMSYLYQLNGVAVIGPNEGDRYYYHYRNACGAVPPIITNPANLQNGRSAPPALFGLDYSNGTSAPLNEASLDETKGLGRDGGAVDWSLDNLTQSNVSVNVDTANAAPVVCPRGTTGGDVLLDNDDWAMVTPHFLRTPPGAQSLTAPPRRLRGGAEAIGDHHRQVIETLLDQ